MDISVIITAAGSSSRMGIGSKKEFLPMNKGTVLSEAAKCFLLFFLRTNTYKCKSFIITYTDNFFEDTKAAVFKDKEITELTQKLKISLKFVKGAETRQLSVFNALEEINNENNTFSNKRTSEKTDSNTLNSHTLDSNTSNSHTLDSNTLNSHIQDSAEIVLIHDGARPWVTEKIIANVIESVFNFGSGVPVIPVTDTIATIANDKTITNYIDRSTTFALQTPQGFIFEKLFLAHKKAITEKRTDCTDDTTIWAKFCTPVHTCNGELQNKKITFKEDIISL